MKAAEILAVEPSFGRALLLLDTIRDGDGALPVADKALLEVAMIAVRDPQRCGPAAERAVGFGATAEQLRAVGLALYLSRGEGPADAVLATAPAVAPEASPPTAHVDTVSSDDIVAEFTAVFDTLPPRVTLLLEHSPEGLEAYHRMRVAVLRHGVLPPALAELVLFAVNVVEHRDDFAAVHATGARNAGAAESQLVEVGLLAIRHGGVAAWLAASEAIAATRPTERKH